VTVAEWREKVTTTLSEGEITAVTGALATVQGGGGPRDSHRGRACMRARQSLNLEMLLRCPSEREFWKLVCSWTDVKSREVPVPVPQLQQTFRERMNVPTSGATDPGGDRRQFTALLAHAIPACTVDTTPQRFFSRPFSMEEMECVRRLIGKCPARSAKGTDGIGYCDILQILNDRLLALFNECMTRRDLPYAWLVTQIVAILKKGRDRHDAGSYRTIGLEACVLKVLVCMADD
jgi:hypothetical protein